MELQALMKYYDIDGDGNVSYEEFLRGLRDELTTRRRTMVDKAFAMMDRDNSGQLNIQDLCKSQSLKTTFKQAPSTLENLGSSGLVLIVF